MRFRSVPLAAAICLVVASPARAQLSVAGAPVLVSPPAGTSTVRWPDVAYDPADDVFLGISGAGAILGAYFSGSGSALGASFVVNSGAVFGQAPRVAYDPDVGGFLVAWHETIGNDTRIRARIIRYGKAALTDDFDLSPFGTNWEMGAAVGYSTTSQEFLVGWQDRATTQIHVQRVSGSGALLGGVITVEATPYARDPSIGFDPDTNRFLVAYAGCVGTDDCFVHAQAIQAGSGAMVGVPIILDAAIKAGYVPEIAYNTITHQFLVVWYRVSGAVAGLNGKTLSAAGVAGPLLDVSPLYASYDANSVAYNATSNTFLVVTHSSTSQDVALELGATGQTLNVSGVFFGPPAVSGNFNPRVAASTLAGDWLAVTSSAFATLTGQRLSTLTRDPTGRVVDAGTLDAGQVPPDAGAPDAGAMIPDAGPIDAGVATPDAGDQTDAGAADAGASSDAGSADAGTARSGAVGSCGCSVNSGLGFDALCAALAAAVSGSLRRRRPARV